LLNQKAVAIPTSLDSGQQHFRQQDISDQRNTRQTRKETCILPQGIKHVHNAGSFEANKYGLHRHFLS